MDGVDNDNDGTFLNNFNSNFQPCDPYGSVMLCWNSSIKFPSLLISCCWQFPKLFKWLCCCSIVNIIIYTTSYYIIKISSLPGYYTYLCCVCCFYLFTNASSSQVTVMMR